MLRATPKHKRGGNQVMETQDPLVDDIQMVDEEQEVLPFRYSITAYGADYPVDSLVKRLDSDSIYVPPFQRGFVWNLKQASRFVESLLLGLPVPGVFLSKDEGSSALLVIDGQQRLKTLQYFYKGIFADSGREFALAGVQGAYNGQTYESLAPDDRLRLDDSIIHATIIRQDVPTEDNSSIYHVFERLNTGGTTLSPQEIRACILHGPLNLLLGEINKIQPWREIFGPVNARMRDQELILRFLAFRFFSSQYSEPLKGFLNAYMGWNRQLTRQSGEELRETFEASIKTVREAIGADAFRPVRALNAAVFDSVLVGISRRIQHESISDYMMVRQRYDSLLSNEDFKNATVRGTASRDSVTTRLELATKAFHDVK